LKPQNRPTTNPRPDALSLSLSTHAESLNTQAEASIKQCTVPRIILQKQKHITKTNMKKTAPKLSLYCTNNRRRRRRRRRARREEAREAQGEGRFINSKYNHLQLSFFLGKWVVLKSLVLVNAWELLLLLHDHHLHTIADSCGYLPP
jgi:hypothetical protein